MLTWYMRRSNTYHTNTLVSELKIAFKAVSAVLQRSSELYTLKYKNKISIKCRPEINIYYSMLTSILTQEYVIMYRKCTIIKVQRN